MDSPDTIATMDRIAEDERHQISRMTEHYIQFVKAVLLFNAGAIVAVLGLLQALASKAIQAGTPDSLHLFKPFGLGAAVLYLIGIGCGAAGFWFSYVLFSRKSRTKEQWGRIVQRCERLPVFGGGAFVVASVVVLLGVAISL